MFVGQQPPAAPPASRPAPDSTREWRLRVPLDSGEVQVAVTTRAAAVTVIAPTGTFLQAFDTAEPLVAWADAGAALQAPQPVPPDTGAAAGAPSRARYFSVRLASLADTAKRFDLTEFQLTRVEGDSAPRYVLEGTNGAWGFMLRVRESQAAALFAALRGDSTSGALLYDLPRKGATWADDRPDVTGAWLSIQVDRDLGPGPRPAVPVYSEASRASGLQGTIELQFVVDETGVVRPSSIRLIGKAPAPLAAAARDAVLSARYRPAERAGRPVPRLTTQRFVFSLP